MVCERSTRIRTPDRICCVAYVAPPADEHRRQLSQDQRAEDGAPVVAARAECGPADDDRGQRLKQVRVADAAVSRAREAGEQDADHRGHERAERERQRPHPPRRYEREVGGRGLEPVA